MVGTRAQTRQAPSKSADGDETSRRGLGYHRASLRKSSEVIRVGRP
jgi:hypothetical protein